jgi:hypothetical protein
MGRSRKTPPAARLVSEGAIPRASRPVPPFLSLVQAPEVADPPLPERAAAYLEFRYMGSKHRLLPWLHGILNGSAN